MPQVDDNAPLSDPELGDAPERVAFRQMFLEMAAPPCRLTEPERLLFDVLYSAGENGIEMPELVQHFHGDLEAPDRVEKERELRTYITNIRNKLKWFNRDRPGLTSCSIPVNPPGRGPRHRYRLTWHTIVLSGIGDPKNKPPKSTDGPHAIVLDQPFSERDVIQIPIIGEPDPALVSVPCIDGPLRLTDARQQISNRVQNYFENRHAQEFAALESLWNDAQGQVASELEARKLKPERASTRAKEIFDKAFGQLAPAPPLWIVILGDTGSGKTTIASDLARSLRSIFVDLRNYSTDLNVLIGQNKFLAYRLHRSPRILVLDAFDKMLPGATYIQTIECLRRIKQTAVSFDVVIVTARSNFFRAPAQELIPNAAIIKLLPIEYHSVLSMADQLYIRPTLEAAIMAEPAIGQLAANPLLLKMLATLIEGGYEIIDLTDRESLFSRLTDKWLDRDSGDSIIPKDKRMKCMQHLAVQALASGGKVFKYQEIDLAAMAVLGPAQTEMLERINTDLRVCGFLRQVAQGNFEFHHAAFYEYCVCRTIFQDLADREFSAIEGHPFTPDIVGFVHNMAVRKRMVDDLVLTILYAWECKLNGVARANLLLIYLSLGGKLADLSFDGIELARQAFSKCRFDNMRAANLVLTECSFSEVYFTNVHAINWQINRSSLKNCNFEQARLDQATMKNPSWEFKGGCSIEFFYCQSVACKLVVLPSAKVRVQGGLLSDTTLGYDGPTLWKRAAKRTAIVRCVVIERMSYDVSMGAWRLEDCTLDEMSLLKLSELPLLLRPSLSRAISNGVSAWTTHSARIAPVRSPKAHVEPQKGQSVSEEPLSLTQLRKRNRLRGEREVRAREGDTP